jgi:hypothetical protein
MLSDSAVIFSLSFIQHSLRIYFHDDSLRLNFVSSSDTKLESGLQDKHG